MSNDPNAVSENNTNGKTNFSTTIIGNPRPRKKEKAWWCLLCLKSGRKSRLQLFQIGFNEAIYLCPEKKCPYPMDDINSVIVSRDLQELYHSMHPTSSQRHSSGNHTEKERVINSLPTSMPRVIPTETPKMPTLSKENTTNIRLDSISSLTENLLSEKRNQSSYSRRYSNSYDDVFTNGNYSQHSRNGSLMNGHSKDNESIYLSKRFDKHSRLKNVLPGEIDFEDTERRLHPYSSNKRFIGNNKDKNRQNISFPIRKIDKTLMKVSGIELNKKFEPFTITKPGEKEAEKTRSESKSNENDDGNETKEETMKISTSINPNSIMNVDNTNEPEPITNGHQPNIEGIQILNTQSDQQALPEASQPYDMQQQTIKCPLEPISNELFANHTQQRSDFLSSNDNNYHVDANYSMAWPQQDNNPYYNQQFMSPSHFDQFNTMMQPIMGPYQTDVIPPPHNFIPQQDFQPDPFYYPTSGGPLFNNYDNNWHDIELDNFIDSLNNPNFSFKDDLMDVETDIYSTLIPETHFEPDINISNQFDFPKMNSTSTDAANTDQPNLPTEDQTISVENEAPTKIDTPSQGSLVVK